MATSRALLGGCLLGEQSPHNTGRVSNHRFRRALPAGLIKEPLCPTLLSASMAPRPNGPQLVRRSIHPVNSSLQLTQGAHIAALAAG
jgi:hypothetical protein